MKDLLEKLNELEKDLKKVNESTDPLKEMASMNISMNGENADEVAQLVNIMKSGGAPDAGPVMSMPPMKMPMDKAISISKGMDMPPDMGPPDMDGPMPLKGSGCGGEEIETEGDWANSPDEKYKDHNYMTKDISGGINKQKKMHKKANDGDNPMALEDEIRTELQAKLSEIMKEGKDKMPSKAHIMKMCKDGKTKAEICKMHPDCDQGKLKDMIDDCKEEMKESVAEAKFEKTGKSGDGSFDESGCVGEMKKLKASGCAKHEMFKKVKDDYGCSKKNFEKLYDAHCG